MRHPRATGGGGMGRPSVGGDETKCPPHKAAWHYDAAAGGPRRAWGVARVRVQGHAGTADGRACGER